MQLARSATFPRPTAHASPWRLVDRRDRIPLLMLVIYAFLLVTAPGMIVVAVGVWWCANTVGHRLVHRPMFEHRAADRALSIILCLVQGFPQRLWRQRHLAHHAGVRWSLRVERWLLLEIGVVVVEWALIAWWVPSDLAVALLIGFLIAQVLCLLQGVYEHRGGTTSCHALWWNAWFLNDGYHAAHHAQPRTHFADLPKVVVDGERVSRWPPVLRWLDSCSLDGLERLVLRSRSLQRAVLRAHRSALRALLAGVPEPRHVAIVGGGLFPRSAILAAELWPAATIEVLEGDLDHLRTAAAFDLPDIRWRHGAYRPGESIDADLVFVPLALRGGREAVFEHPPARWVIVHDWIWSRREGASAIVAWWLLKRVHLVVTADRSLNAASVA